MNKLRQFRHKNVFADSDDRVNHHLNIQNVSQTANKLEREKLTYAINSF